MLKVNVASSNPLSEIENLAIAIGSKGGHIGIFFHPDGHDLQMIHLAWHDDFRCGKPDLCWHGSTTTPDNDFCWIPCAGINSIVLANIADWLSSVWEINGHKIPYSIKPFDKTPFDESGKLHSSEPGDGFTCATFVLWVFSHSEIELVNKDTWEARAEDRDWQEKIMEYLDKCPTASKAHIEAQREYVNLASRFRPVEVASAAGVYKGTSIVFSEAVELGNSLKSQMSIRGLLQ